MQATNLNVTACTSKHLTAFAGFYVAPNSFPVPTFALFKEGYVLLIAVCIINLLFILGLAVLRRIDKEDALKVGH